MKSWEPGNEANYSMNDRSSTGNEGGLSGDYQSVIEINTCHIVQDLSFIEYCSTRQQNAHYYGYSDAKHTFHSIVFYFNRSYQLQVKLHEPGAMVEVTAVQQ